MAAYDELPAELRQHALSELTGIRQSIDNIDAALIHMLAERFKFTQQVGRLKAASGMPASDRERETVQIAHLRTLAEESRLDPAFAEKFLNFIVAEVIHHHEEIAGGESTARAAMIGGSGPGSSANVDTALVSPAAIHPTPDDSTPSPPAVALPAPGRPTLGPRPGPRPGPPTRSIPIS